MTRRCWPRLEVAGDVTVATQASRKTRTFALPWRVRYRGMVELAMATLKVAGYGSETEDGSG